MTGIELRGNRASFVTVEQPNLELTQSRLSRRTLMMGGAALLVHTMAGAANKQSLVFGETSGLSNVDPNLVADNFIRDEVSSGMSLDEIGALYGSDEVDEQPEQTQTDPEPKEAEPKPAPKGLEQFKSKKLPGSVIDRIKRGGLPGKIDAQRHVYDHAAKETGVPWQLMAAINYREASLRPELSMLDGSSLTAGVSQDGVKIYNNAKKDAVAAANILVGNAKRYYDVDLSKIDQLPEEDIANALLAYNRGAMYLNDPGKPMPVEKSPYVYNYMDGKAMKWTRADSYNGSKWLNGMYDKGMVDGNLGALVIVSYLMQNN